MHGASTLPERARRVEDELLEHYARQGARVPAPVMLAALLVAVLAWERAPRALTVGWLSAVAVVLLVRGLVIGWLPRLTRLSLRVRLGLAAVISAAGGIVHGASVAFWPYLGDLERAVQSVFVLGLCAGAVATQMGYMPVLIAYLLPMLTPLALAWAGALAGSGGAWYRGASGVMVVLFMAYGGLLVVLARDTFGLYRDSFDSRQRLSLALEQAESANRAKTRFLASASHDLRQPMHTLTLFGAALSMCPLDERTRGIASQMNVALQALGSQLDALLDISKLDAGVVPVKPGSFALGDFVKRLADEFAPVAQRKGLALASEAPPGAYCFTDPALFERIVRNLLDNAIKYTAHGRVDLRACRAVAGFELQVRDTGPGIAPAEQARVFEEFYQIDNPERDRTQGLGLGLSIVRRLAELLGIDLSMASAVGQGTQFTLRVPAAGAAPLGCAALPRMPALSIRGLHVLVVDDEEAVRQGMRTLLEGLGCRASTAAGTHSALRSVGAQRPDIVLADFRLRGDDDGIAAVQCLRARWPGLAALLVSGDTAPARLREADAAGLRLLHKPVAVDTLLHAIREEVDRATRQRA